MSTKSSPWIKGWPDVNGWYWMRNFRHYRMLPVELSDSGIAVMFSFAIFTKSDTDIQEAEFCHIPPPVPSPSGITGRDETKQD